MTEELRKEFIEKIPDPAFLIFSISPVQGFIGTAKKTKDFWLGSYILSYLAWQGLEIVTDKFGPGAVIFPDLERQPFFLHKKREKVSEENLKTPTIPNRFVTKVSYEKGKELLSEIEKKVMTGFEEIGAYVLGSVNGLSPDDTFNTIFKRQTGSFFQCNGILLPWSLDESKPQDVNPDNVCNRIKKLFGEEFEKETLRKARSIDNLYPVLYDIAERFSASLKSSRTISVEQPELGHKCTLCGEREALHLDGQIGWADLTRFWNGLSKANVGDISEGEKLCGVCLTKRVSGKFFSKKYGIKESFPSTADVATAGFKHELKKKINLKEDYDDFLEGIPKEYRDDGEWLYPDFYDSKKIAEKSRNGKPEVSDPASLKRKLNKFLKKAKDKHNLVPSRYYALIKLDGDNMGRILKGELHGGVSRAVHREISAALGKYSLGYVRTEVEELGRGKVIFAGGDDVFAMLPPEYFFAAINRLRACYSTAVHKEATASLGAAIVHWEEPLSLAIKLADHAEHTAKEVGRNAFCIMLKRRSGELRQCCFNWYFEADKGKRLDVIEELIEPLKKAFRDDALSPRFIQALKMEFFRMDSNAKDDEKKEEEKIDDDMRNIFLLELKRTMARSCKPGKGEKEKLLHQITNALDTMYAYYRRSRKDDSLWQPIDPFHSLKNILYLFETLHFLAGGGEQ